MTEHTLWPIRTQTIEFTASDGAVIRAFVAQPDRPGRWPGIVLGAEALGINNFMRDVAKKNAARGYVAIIPDYYRENGPADPENYTDFTDVFTAINALDFRRASYDLLDAIKWLREQPNVDPDRIATWGYCTGGTLSMLTACLDRSLSAAILFFPSQAVFETLTPKRPAHPMDLVWNINCPVLVIYGDEDYLMPPERLAELRHRLEQWRIPHEMMIWPGGKHSFTALAPALHNAEASAAAWSTATAFIDRVLGAEKAV